MFNVNELKIVMVKTARIIRDIVITQNEKLNEKLPFSFIIKFKPSYLINMY
jgi:hypothetical protein